MSIRSLVNNFFRKDKDITEEFKLTDEPKTISIGWKVANMYPVEGEGKYGWKHLDDTYVNLTVEVSTNGHKISTNARVFRGW